MGLGQGYRCRLPGLFVYIGLCCLFTLGRAKPGFESGILPHFKVDHVAGKLKISASRDAADISYKNDNVDVTVKPNNKEAAKVVIDSMRDSDMGRKLAAAKKDEGARATARSINEKSLEEGPKGPKVHMDSSYNDIALRRSTVRKHEVDESGNKGSDVTWRGRITHSTDEPDNNHVLSALNEIKSLMTLSMKPPNLKAFDQVLPLDHEDKYLNTPDVMKKLNHAAHKKRRTGTSTPESHFSSRKSAKHVVNSTPHNSTYSDDSVPEYNTGYSGKSQFIRVPHHHASVHKQAARKHMASSTARRHTRKKCVRGHCRQEIFGGPDIGPNPDAPDGAFEELYLGKIKEHHDGHDSLPAEFRNRDPDYDTLNDIEDHEHAERAEHEPSHEDHDGYHSPKSHKGTNYASPFHEREHEDSYKELYGDDGDHHPSHDEVDGFHGEGGGSHHGGALSSTSGNANNPDAAFEKEFESKISDKDYNDDGREIHHSTRHESHRPNHGDEYVDEGDHYPHSNDGDVGDMGLFEHGDSMGERETPSESHHLHNNYHEQLGNENESDSVDENDETPSNPSNYDFDESKELKDEEHEDPDVVHMNGKLRDWYTANAIGDDNATTIMEEPVHHIGGPTVGKDTHPDTDNKTHIETKFENAGEKPLNSSAAEQAISKLNESLAKGLNESTNNVISSSNSSAAAKNATTEGPDAGNSTVSLISNSTENATSNDSVENGTATNSTKSTNSTNSTKVAHSVESDFDKDMNNSSASIFNLTHDTIQLKISNLEKKVNNSGDLLRQLEDIERKLNATAVNKTTEALKKPLTDTEKELLRVTPEDILQTHLPDSDDLGALHDTNLARHLNSTTKEPKEEKKNVTASKGTESEKAYASIGSPGNNSTKENSTHTDEGSAAAEDGSGAGVHLEKHAELNQEKSAESSEGSGAVNVIKEAPAHAAHHKFKTTGAETRVLKPRKSKVKQIVSRRHKVTASKRHHTSHRRHN